MIVESSWDDTIESVIVVDCWISWHTTGSGFLLRPRRRRGDGGGDAAGSEDGEAQQSGGSSNGIETPVEAVSGYGEYRGATVMTE